MHVGSFFAISSTPRNILQQRLLNGYKKCIDRIKQPKRVKELLIGGDMVDGNNPAKPGKDIWTVYPQIAVNDCVVLLTPLLRMARYRSRVVRGSGYHVEHGKTNINNDELLAQAIKATPIENGLLQELPQPLEDIQKTLTQFKSKNLELRQLKEQVTQALTHKNNGSELEMNSNLDIPFARSANVYRNVFNEVALTLRHHVAFSPNYMYRGTGLIRNDLLMTLQKDRQFKEKYSSIINAYGHVHYYHFGGNATHLNFTIPCWKHKDSFLDERDVTQPDFGIVEVIIEPNSEYSIHPYTLTGDDYPTA